MKDVIVIEHPLVQHKLGLLRNKDTSCNKFRNVLRELSLLMAYEVTREMPLTHREIQTPFTTMQAPFLDGKKVVLISILRAGNGLLDGMLQLIPSARVGHIGLYRDPRTLIAVEYYFKMPGRMEDRETIVVDPLLATGHSAVAAIQRLKGTKPRSIKFVCLLAAPQDIREMHEYHPDVTIYTAAIDDGLNKDGYIIPGLGDAGDRIFGTT